MAERAGQGRGRGQGQRVRVERAATAEWAGRGSGPGRASAGWADRERPGLSLQEIRTAESSPESEALGANSWVSIALGDQTGGIGASKPLGSL